MTVPTALERVGNFSQSLNPRRERQSGAGAHLRSVQRRAGRPRPLPPRRDPERDHPEPRSVRAPDVQLLPAAEPDAGRRLQHEQLRVDDDARPCAGTAPTTASTSSWKNHSIYGSGGISYAEIITPRPFGTAPFNDADGVRSDKNPVHPAGRRRRAQPDAGARRSLWPEPDQHQERSAATRPGSTTTRRSACRATCMPLILFPGTAPNVNPNGYGGGSGGGSNWTRADDGQLQYEARIPDQPQRHRQHDEDPRQVGAQGRHGVPQSAVELRTIPSRARWRCRRRSRTRAATSTSST